MLADDRQAGALLSPAEIARRLATVMDAAGAASGVDRARLIIVRDGRLAAIERHFQGRLYWVIPGGGVEEGETFTQAALREGAEELGVGIRLGPLRAIVDSRTSGHRHWCFEATVDSAGIRIAGGPEAEPSPADGSYAAVWLDPRHFDLGRVWPPAIARLAGGSQGWPADILQFAQE